MAEHRVGIVGFVNTEEILADTIRQQSPDVIIDGYEVLNPTWLRSADLAQTPREDLIAELLDRYYTLSTIFDQFKDFTFVPKKPTRILIL